MAWTTTAISATFLTWASRSNPPSFPQGYAYGGPAPPPGLCCRGAAPDPVGGAMWGAASPPHAVRKGRCASPPRRLPSTPLLTGLPPRFFRHWRRSAPPPLRWVFHQRQKGNEKTRPFVQPSYAPSTTRKKVVATASRCEGVYNRAGEPSVPFSGGMGQGLCVLDLRPCCPQARRRRERVAGAYADRRQQCLGAAGP